jgi:hypothetical protein
LKLYPPSGNALISSLGLQSSSQCADDLNDPYEGTLFKAYNTHDTVNYLWFDPADVNCPVGEAYDGKDIAIFIPIKESITDAQAALNESKMALNAKLSFVWKASGTIFEIDILADQLSR